MIILEARRYCEEPEKWAIVRRLGDHTWTIKGSQADDEITAWKQAATLMFDAHQSVHRISSEFALRDYRL